MARFALARAALPMIQILLVEDNPSDAFAVDGLLTSSKKTDYKIHHAKTQAEGATVLATQSFDVCLLDITLPDASGFSALVDIQEKAPGMPILILTGHNDTVLARRAVSRGAQDYLLKDELEASVLTRAIDYAMERKRVEKGLFQRANYDALTGLANRDLFLSRLDMALARAERAGASVAVLFIDLDGFKPINDNYGHDSGDEVLKAIAQRIKAALRAYDTPARFGGDEFAVLLEGIEDARDAAAIAQKIIREIGEPVACQGRALSVGASIGVAYTNAQLAGETLLGQADTAMYHAKKEGGAAYRFFVSDMHAEALARLSLEEDLRTALLMSELELYYQPYIHPVSQAVMGVEALLRWAHPERGMLSAGEFLPAAEEARLMPEIGRWMCAQLRGDIAMWNAHGVQALTISINLSRSQLDLPELTGWFSGIAKDDCLGPHRLAVEVPEEAITPISGACFMTLARLHEMGLALHLDHFGLTALPLTTLCSLPFSLLKLDLSLIQNMHEEGKNNILISAAIMLAHHLGMKAGAVGVEAAWQAESLAAQDCDTIQGFLTVPPMQAARLAQWLVNDINL